MLIFKQCIEGTKSLEITMDPTLKVILRDGPNVIDTYEIDTLLSTARQEDGNLSDTEKQFVSKIKYILDCPDRVAVYNSEKQPWLLNNLFMNTITDLGNTITQESIDIMSYSKAISAIGQIIEYLDASDDNNENLNDQEIPQKNNLSAKELFGKLLELIQQNRLYQISNRVNIVNYLTLIRINGLDEIATLRSGRVYVNNEKEPLITTTKLVMDKISKLLINEYLLVDYENLSTVDQASLVEKINLIINDLSPMVDDETKLTDLDEYTGPNPPPIPDLLFTVKNIFLKLSRFNINHTNNQTQEYDIYRFLNESYMLLTIYSNKIKKLQHATAVEVDGHEISLEEWEEQNLADQNEIVKNTSCYNIPKSWLLAIKNHKFTTSNYIKQALFEKLTRDGLI